MYLHLKEFNQRKMTKRQRKLLDGPNAATQRSIDSGYKQGGYVGAPPQFGTINENGVDKIVKIANGIPFVRPDNFGDRP